MPLVQFILVAKGPALQKINGRNSHILINMSSRCDLDLQDSKQIISRDAPARNDAALHHNWFQKVERFKRCRPMDMVPI